MRLKYYCFKVQQTAAERARKKKKTRFNNQKLRFIYGSMYRTYIVARNDADCAIALSSLPPVSFSFNDFEYLAFPEAELVRIIGTCSVYYVTARRYMYMLSL